MCKERTHYKELILMILLVFNVLLLTLVSSKIIKKIDELEKNQLEINEYILDRIGG